MILTTEAPVNALNVALRTARRIGRRVKLAAERGATSVEYGIMASLIAAVIVSAVFFLGQRTNANFACTKNSIVAMTTQC